MNKTIPFILFSLVASIILMWYLAHREPTATRTPDQNVLIVGTNAEYKPFAFQEDNAILGFDIDLIQEVAKRIGKTVELHDMPFDALIHSLQIGAIQVIAAGITPTAERAQRVLFTKPYLANDLLLIVSRAQEPLTSVDQLRGKKVAVNEGFTADYYMSKIEGPELVRFAALLESFMALESGQVDALVAAQTSVNPLIQHYGANAFAVNPIPDTSDTYALAISKKNAELLEPIQKALDALEQEGVIAQLKEKWGLA
jgi:arginine/lysine/histidine transporter system substrate-binding protein